MHLPMTLSLFDALFKLDKPHDSKLLWTFVFVNKTLVIHPDLNDLKKYMNKTIWVGVPKALGYPYRYLPPVY